jgi:hypothetical protein
MDEIGKALAAYAGEVADLAGSPGSTEATFYPAIHRLLSAVLHARNLPFDVRANTSQRRSGGGTDLPDLAFYDSGDFVVVFGEVKTPATEIEDLAASTERDDQVGRYLASVGVVLLSNVRGFSLLWVDPAYRTSMSDPSVPVFSTAVQPLLDDFYEALGLSFEGSEGEEFLRSSLIQTAFYGLFASWTHWHHSGEPREFHWRDLGNYLKIPFLGALFYEFRHPVRLKELGLAPHLDRATATLRRVAEDRFFGRFAMPAVVARNGAESTATPTSPSPSPTSPPPAAAGKSGCPTKRNPPTPPGARPPATSTSTTPPT